MFLVTLMKQFQDGQEKDPREAADERVHGLGSGGPQKTRRSISESAQRRTE